MDNRFIIQVEDIAGEPICTYAASAVPQIKSTIWYKHELDEEGSRMTEYTVVDTITNIAHSQKFLKEVEGIYLIVELKIQES